jgi:hypothetical protein
MVRKLPQDPTDNMSKKAEEFTHEIPRLQILAHSTQTRAAFASLNLTRAFL